MHITGGRVADVPICRGTSHYDTAFGTGHDPARHEQPEPGPAPPGAAPPGAPAGRQVARFALPPEPESPKHARDFTTGTLRRWGLAGLCRDAMVVVSELVTNALRHARPAGPGGAGGRRPIQVILFGADGELVCAVTDPSRRSPVLREPDDAAETGRGLQVVASLSDRWGWLPLDGGGKAVWAALGAPPPDRDRGDAAGPQRTAGGPAMASCEDDCI